MSKRAAAFLAFVVVLAACNAPGAAVSSTGAASEVRYTHDEAHRVGCWTFGGDGTYGKAISCLPDSEYRP